MSLLVSFIFAIGISIFINYQIQKSAKNISQKTSSNADVVVNNVHYTEDKDGNKQWELEALKAQYFKEGDVTIFENVNLTLYAKNGKVYVIKGKNGKLMNETKDVEVNGNVTVTSEDGYKLNTESLKYAASGKQITTNDKVSLTGPRMDVDGIGLLIDMNKETVSVLKNARAVIKNAKT
ncbi:MAG: LPS export ABC transporter periplasmic protein LptC [Deltaproteobacteria bacterium]|nr:LPS export ABC transporter periplasmic protein LptC [Deltaproteobacteria bacterium]